MKPFTKRLALVMGLLFTALICLGVVFIDTTANYWKFSGGFIQLVVNTNGINTNLQASFTVDTNTLRVGIKTNNATFGVMIRGALPPDNVASSTGTSAANSGAVRADGGAGGSTIIPTTGTGGAGGNIVANGGAGGSALFATTNATGGAGGAVTITSGIGANNSGGVATNRSFGGAGGQFTLAGGAGGAPDTPATNTLGGAGGAFSLIGGAGAAPSAGWARQGGAGGGITANAGAGGNSARTNSGAGGSVSYVAGNSGAVQTAPGTAGLPGNVSFTAGNSGGSVAGGNVSPGGMVNMTAGNGSTGDTNSDGGHVFLTGGSPGVGAVPGNVVLARNSGGVAQGGVQIGPLITGGSATITNVLGAAASLDFPSTVAGTFSELAIAVTGVTSNNVAVALSVPWESAQTGGGFVTFNSNDAVYVRFLNNQLVSAIDPAPGTFTVVGFRIR